MTTIIKSASKDRYSYLELEMDRLQSDLRDLLQKKKYLIVLDDVWCEDQDEWDRLRPLLKAGVDGSKVIVTTRSRKVEFSLDSPTHSYYLKGLEEDDCWALFKQRAFQRGEEEIFPNLAMIGKQIVRKCRGIPLAAKTLGSLMRFKRGQREWLSVQNSELWKLKSISDSDILPALMLSYLHLPCHLRHCFAFCSIFPRGYDIKKEKLVHLWMAEGLIQSSRGYEEPEDTGADYFNNLLWLGFLQEGEVYEEDDDVITCYRMHDIVHELARHVGHEETIILENDLPSSNLSEIRRISVVSDFRSSNVPEALYKAEHLRTLLMFMSGNLTENPTRTIFTSLKYLRILDLSATMVESIDDSICNLVCLRYLDLSYTHIKKLPSAIESLCCLQTLSLFHCRNLVELPRIEKFMSLRHLIITGCHALTRMIPSTSDHGSNFISDLASNQIKTCSMIIVHGRPDLLLLGQLNLLQGKLQIKCLQNVTSPYDGKLADLKRKVNLESLELCWGNEDDIRNLDPLMMSKPAEVQQNMPVRIFSPEASLEGEIVINNLEPHQNLKRLSVKGFPGRRFPQWTLPNLKVVNLENCVNLEVLPALGNLTFLKKLSLQRMHAAEYIEEDFYGRGTREAFSSLQRMHAVEYIEEDFYGRGTREAFSSLQKMRAMDYIEEDFYCRGNREAFSSLEELILKDFPNLEEWFVVGRYAFRNLEKLIVNKCPKLRTMPSIYSLQHLELRDCRASLFSCVQNFTNLTVLAIENVEDFVDLSPIFLGNSHCLTSLEIISCPKLR